MLDAPAADESALLDVLRHAALGEYEIMGELGRGGMACVYLAHDIALDRKVAIKVMLPDVTRQEGMIERFRQEARTAANLGHPHIIPIYAVRQTERTLFFVMKYVEGRPLDTVIRELRQLPFDMARTILRQVAGALDYAHRKGVVHRDVKPANIMIDGEGFAVVTDFGIAKLTHAPGLTISGSVVGTPYYMSPEQAEGAALTGASDQYSLGILAYEMLGGRLPYENPSLMALLLAHREATPPPLSGLRPDCPAPMRDAVERMIAKKAEQRFPSLREAAAAFCAAAHDDAETVRSTMIALARSNPKPIRRVSTPRSPAPAFPPKDGARQRQNAGAPVRPLRRWLVAGTAVAGLGALAFGAWQALSSGSRPGDVAADTPAVRPVITAPVAPPAGDSLASARESAATSAPPPAPAASRGTSTQRQARPAPPPAPPPAPAPVPVAAPAISTGWVRIGAPEDTIPVILYINGDPRGGLSRLQNFAVPAGRIRLELRAAGCTSWDSSLLVAAGDTARIGRRRPSC